LFFPVNQRENDVFAAEEIEDLFVVVVKVVLKPKQVSSSVGVAAC